MKAVAGLFPNLVSLKHSLTHGSQHYRTLSHEFWSKKNDYRSIQIDNMPLKVPLPAELQNGPLQPAYSKGCQACKVENSKLANAKATTVRAIVSVKI